MPHVSNEEYYERWEAAAKKPSHVDRTPQEIAALQGTRTQDENPWGTYMTDTVLTPEMEAAVAEYAGNVHDDSSNQTKEELCRQKEISAEVAKEYQWCTPEEYKDVQMRFGRIMHRDELITKLRTECHLKVFYRQHPHADKLTLVYSDSMGMKRPEVACWVQNGYMPEYTVMGFDDHGVPLAEKYRGWRTCLLQLILKGLLTIELAHKVFGEANLPCSDRYNSILHSWKNRTEECV
jgi:hypothetical protein